MYAFPMGEYFDDDEKEMKQQHGMLLRDYIAIKAMQGMYASGLLEAEHTEELIAKDAYKQADAMMEARKQ